MKMEMLQLRYFYESALSESFSKTAQKYMVPVSSVSASVKRLETELGVALFERTGNRIYLTEKGRLFLKTVEHLTESLESGVQAVRSTHENEERLTLLVFSNRKMVMNRILRFRKLYPSVSFRLDISPQKEHITDYDIVIGNPGEPLDGYDSFEFSRYTVKIEALSSDPLAQRTITLDQLRDRSFVTLNRQKMNGGFQALSQACMRCGFTPKIAIECNDYECRDACVLSGAALGITLSQRNGHSPLQNVQFLEISDFSETTVNNFYYKKTAYRGAVKLFVDFMKNY